MRYIAAGLLVTLLLVGSPMVPPAPVYADSTPVFVLLPNGAILVLEGDPDTPDGTDSGPNYVVYNENGDQIQVDHNWLTDLLFTTFGTLFGLTK